MMGGIKMGLWKQKSVTVQNAIALGGGFANLIADNLPSGVTFTIIVNNNLDSQAFINNQLVCGVYDSAHEKCNNFTRYRNGTYSGTGETSSVWSDTYALTASAGDTYTLFYQ